MMRSAVGIAAVVLALDCVTAMDNGLALRPPLGWSTWQTCGDEACSHDACTEDEVKSVATAMQTNGMQALGFNYVNLDDCWTTPERNSTNGRLAWDVTRFPSGIPALTDWLHARGFKFGIYTSAGNATCAGKAGSRNNYPLDAQSFADWGVDYVKFDWCGDIKKEVWLGAQAHRDWAAAVNATNHPMLIEVVAGYLFLLNKTASVANTWRFCVDHHDVWKSTDAQLLCRVDQPSNGSASSPGGWASMDFLMTGGAGCAAASHCPGQTDDEYKTEFVIWSLTQSPLMVDTDVRNMTQVMRAALLNAELIQLHQSIETPPGTQLGYWLPCDEALACGLWGRKVDVAGTSWVIALVNTGSKSHTITFDFDRLGDAWGAESKATVKDVWTNSSAVTATGSYQAVVPTHGTEVVMITLQH